MKLAPENVNEDRIEISAEEQEKKIIKYIGSQRKIQGLTLWEYNQKTNELNLAKFKKQDVIIESLEPSEGSAIMRHKVDTNEDCFYFQALNRKNAEKKLQQLINQL
jgi:hypothetical protein